tara:strand:- start:29346 stop:30326 length:981 start_codon:yes stop_codon:yes gene_type:complete
MATNETAKPNPMVKPAIPKVMMGRGGYLNNEERIKKDEEEFLAMKKAALEAKGIITDEESSEDKPSSEEPKAEPVQAESDTKQEEKPEAKAQEEDDLGAEEKNFKKRYGDLRRHSQKKEEEFNAKIAALEAKLDKASKQELVLPKTDEELEAWSKEYPDIAGIIESIADKKAKASANALEERMVEFEEMRINATREKAEAELIKMHPDFVEIREDDTFHNWAKDQPKWVQDALYENVDDAKSVARVIDLYKVDKGITKVKKSNSSDKAAASSVKTKSAAAPEPDEASKYVKESEVEAMSIKEYEKRQEEILDAQRNGRFIYDVSRK